MRHTHFASAFWGRVAIGEPDECWPWMRATFGDEGYGAVCYQSDTVGAHRMAYFLSHGMMKLPPDQCICHTCDYPPCCNPDHLWIGSKGDNYRDAVSKGRWHQNFKPGTKHPMAKLTEAKVAEARALRASGKYTTAAIAKRFGVSGSTMSVALRGLKWKHVL